MRFLGRYRCGYFCLSVFFSGFLGVGVFRVLIYYREVFFDYGFGSRVFVFI